MTVFSGTLWCSVKEDKALFLFDGEQGIALHAMQGNRASSCAEGEFSWFFSSCGGNLGYILELRRRWPFKTRLCSATSELKSRCEGHLGFSSRFGSREETPLEVKLDPGSHSSCHRHIGIPINFQRSQALYPFETLNSACLSRGQRDVRPPVEMRWRPRAFSRVSTGDSDIPSSCEVKGKPAFKSLQGNLAFFRVRVSRRPFHLRQQTQVPLTYL